MKPIKSSIAVLSIIFLGGCAAFSQDRHPQTETSYSGEKERLFWSDHTWREAISRQWRTDEQRLSRFRLSEFSE